jgi:predicted nucleotidyltransferase
MAGRPEVRFAYLYGSILERATIGDVDVAVSVQPDSLPTDITAYELTLESMLERGLDLPVDVRVLEDAPLSFRYAVSRGDAVYVRDPEALATFREHTWSAYLDFAPLRERVLRDLTGRPGRATPVTSDSFRRR